jgi:hypothetical protein
MTKDYRIGNLIFDEDCEPYHFEIEEMRKHVGYELWAYYRNGSIKSKEPTPIPLTEEWLLKFGFVKSPAGNSVYLSIPELKAEIHFENFMGGMVCVLYCSTGSFIPNEIKYLHQIQNLYFALTGEELKLTK